MLLEMTKRLNSIKRLAVIPVVISVPCSDLWSIRHCDGESIRIFFTRIKGKAATCAYTVDCSQPTCNQSGLDASFMEETVEVLNAKEMPKEVLNRNFSTNVISSFWQKKKHGKKNLSWINCQSCKNEIKTFCWSKRHKKLIEQKYCLVCWQKNSPRQQGGLERSKDKGKDKSDPDAIAIGGRTSTPLLDHMLFYFKSGWKRIESMKHPTLKLTVSVGQSCYREINPSPPNVKPSSVTVVTNTGAQSCLWGFSGFLRCGFNTKDLIPVKHTLYAANKEKMDVLRDILIRLNGTTGNGDLKNAAIMAYVSPNTQRLYLSQEGEAWIQLGLITRYFPRIGSADENCTVLMN